MMRKKLKYQKTIKFATDVPFSFGKTVHSFSRFPSKLELFKDNCFYVALNIRNITAGLKYYMKNGQLYLDVYSENKLNNQALKEISEEVKFRFSLDVDYSQFYQRYSSDKFLKDIIKRNYGKRIFSMYSLYENLMVSIFLQNATVQRTITMCSNMLEKYGTLLNFDDIELYAIWEPKDFSPTEEELRNLKVGYRAKNFLRVTEFFRKSNVSEQELRKLTTDLLEKELLKIYGVGKQTVFYTMLGQFHRIEYLKHIPLWERKILSKYIFNKDLCEEKYIVNWFHAEYGEWCGFTLSMIFEDIFYQHKQKPIQWLKEIMRDG